MYVAGLNAATIKEKTLFDLPIYTAMRDDTEMQKCIPNLECRRDLYQASQKIQDSLVRKYGSQLFDGIPPEDSSQKVPTFSTQLESLTNGEMILTGTAQEWDTEEIESFRKVLARSYVKEMHTVFNSYTNSVPLENYDNELLVSSSTSDGIKYGLDAFSVEYFKSPFALMGVYPHYLGGYDLLIYFVNKPDILFRVWVEKTGEGADEKWQMRMFGDTGVSDKEVRALAKEYSLVVAYFAEDTFNSSQITTAGYSDEELMKGIKYAESKMPPRITGDETEEDIYKNPYITHIRTALNGYLDGSNNGAEEAVALDNASASSADCGLGRFDKSYYKSKFFVYDVSDSEYGGVQAWIVFIDKPDTIFWTWVYQLANKNRDYSLRGFCKSGPPINRAAEFTTKMNMHIKSDGVYYSL